MLEGGVASVAVLQGCGIGVRCRGGGPGVEQLQWIRQCLGGIGGGLLVHGVGVGAWGQSSRVRYRGGDPRVELVGMVELQ